MPINFSPEVPVLFTQQNRQNVQTLHETKSWRMKQFLTKSPVKIIQTFDRGGEGRTTVSLVQIPPDFARLWKLCRDPILWRSV